MKKKNQFAMKFAIVALTVGLFSPSFNVDTTNVDTTKNMKDSYSMTLPKIEITLFNEAEARPRHRQARRTGRRSGRRAARRTTHRHNAYGGGRYYGSNNNNRRNTRRAAAAGVVTGVVIGSAVANNRNRY